MRTGAAAGHTGYFHEAALYRSTDELTTIVSPFLLGGIAAGEPTMVSFGDEHAALIRADLDRRAPGAATQVTFLAGGAVYARPASAIRAYRAMLAEHVERGATQIRIVGELPPATFGETWDWWARYESAINQAYDEFPLWSMCAYDVVATPDRVLHEVARTHPRTATPDGRHPASDRYTEPAVFLTETRPNGHDPLQRTPATVELTDPMPAAVRQAIAEHVPAALAGPDLDGFVTSASEVVTNAIRHGRAPVRVRLWSAADRMILAVTDRGRGPTYPYAGLLPYDGGGPGGLGLWLSHQLCSYVAFGHDDDGFTISLTAGATGHR